MGELMRAIRLPAVDMMRLQSENARLREQLGAAEVSNDVLTQELEEAQKELVRVRRENRVLRAERDDARHERDDLRDRRDKAYVEAIAGSKQARQRWKKIERALFAALMAAWGIPAMIILFGKAVEWIRWLMGR